MNSQFLQIPLESLLSSYRRIAIIFIQGFNHSDLKCSVHLRKNEVFTCKSLHIEQDVTHSRQAMFAHE